MFAIRPLSLLTLLLSLSVAQAAPTGTVVATEDGGSYTYVQIDTGAEKLWYAVPAIELTLGESVIVPAGMAMKDFYSQTLDRTFSLVYFAGGINRPAMQGKAGGLPSGHPPINATTPQESTDFDFSKIERPAGGKTVAEIHQESAVLSGKRIKVQGIAVKVSNHIMGRNWVHLRDGSGEPGTDDLTVTTTNLVEVGNTITASGLLATDRDFGSGYTYSVLLEEATLTK